MKITRRQLRQIIEERVGSGQSMSESALPPYRVTRNIDDAFYDLQRNLGSILGAAGIDREDPGAREYIKRKIDEMIRDYGF